MTRYPLVCLFRKLNLFLVKENRKLHQVLILVNMEGNISSEVMTWQSGTKVISITFSNGKVMAKAQNGL